MNECEPCGRPTTNYLCKWCIGDINTKLTGAGELLKDLDITIGRRDKLAPAGPRIRGATTVRMPVNITAVDVKSQLIDAIMGVHIGTNPMRARYFDDGAQLAAATRAHLDRLSTNPKAPGIHAVFLDAHRRALEAIDLPPERVRVGTCGSDIEGEVCEEGLFAAKDEPWVHCKTCGTTWDVAEHRRRALDDAENVEAYPSVLVKVLAASGYKVTQKRFDKWVYNGQILHADVDSTGRKLYRLGDARALADGSTTNTVKQIVTRRVGACSRRRWGVGWIYNHAKPIQRAA